MNTSESRAGPVALMVLGIVAALVCVSAIGAATTLVVIAIDQPASAKGGECRVVAWNAGMVHCFRAQSGEASKPVRYGPVVVVQAQADSAR